MSLFLFFLISKLLNSAILGAEITMKRFWTTVGIDERQDAFAVTLDKRPLKTPSGKTLLLPKNKTLVATLVATEWEHQEILLKPHALPMVSFMLFYFILVAFLEIMSYHHSFRLQ